MSENVGASTSRNPEGLHGLYRENFTIYIHDYVTICKKCCDFQFLGTVTMLYLITLSIYSIDKFNTIEVS
jgi:hypothetical protein